MDHTERGPVSYSITKRRKKVVIHSPLRSPSISRANTHQGNSVVKTLLEYLSKCDISLEIYIDLGDKPVHVVRE